MKINSMELSKQLTSKFELICMGFMSDNLTKKHSDEMLSEHKQKIEFMQLGDTVTLIMLNILQIDKDTMKCKYCNAKVNHTNCSIFPGKEKGSVIIACNSELCISEWMTEMED